MADSSLPVRTVSLASSDPAITLSARLAADTASTSTSAPRLGLLLLHAYPRLGGCSGDPIVTATFHAARKREAGFSVVLRYDQRGVGRSGGGKAVWGWADAADAAAIAGRMLEGSAAPGVPAVERLYVLGYSWGSALAALGVVGAGLAGVAGWVGVSPPLGGLAALTLRTGRVGAALGAHPAVPGLVILGDRDQFCGVAAAERAVAGVNAARAATDGAEKVDLAVVEGADHFWGGAAWDHSWGEVAARALGWVREVEKRRRGE